MNLEPLYTLIKRFEGLRLKPYLCPAGIPTIGYGHTGRDVTMNSSMITVEKAEQLLEQDVAVVLAQVLKVSPSLANDSRKLCAIADFCYNLGITKYKASTLKKRIDVEDWGSAKEELKKWVWGGGRRLPGLVLRREAESMLLN